MATKTALSFDKRGYNKAEQAHTEYKSAKAQLTALIDSNGVDGKALIESPQIYKDTIEAIFNVKVGDKVPVDNKIKFVEDFLGVDVKTISIGVNKFNSLKKFSNKPKKEAFTTYLNEANREAYNDLNELVKLLNKLDKKGYISSKMAIQSLTSNKVAVDVRTGQFKFNS